MRKYERRTAVLSFEQAKHWEPRYAVGAMLYAAVLGVWCFITIYGNDDAVAHMLCVAVTVGYTAGGAARNYGRPKLIQYHILLACGPMSLALALHGGFYYIGLAVLLVLFFVGLKGINLSLHADFRQGADVELPRSGAGRPVRYRAEQHAARAVHVPRRRTARGDESSFQRDDGSVRRSRAARRDRRRHHRGLRSPPDRSRPRAAR